MQGIVFVAVVQTLIKPLDGIIHSICSAQRTVVILSDFGGLQEKALALHQRGIDPQNSRIGLTAIVPGMAFR